MTDDIIRIVRILEYVGPRSDLEESLQHTAVPMNGEHRYGRCVIRSATLGSFAEVLERASTREDSTEADPNHGG
jgi:hypothetical protein